MATHIIDLPSGKSVSAIIEKGQETFLNQSFASVVKTLEKLPSETVFPVKLNFTPSPDACTSLSSSSNTVDASIASKVNDKDAFKTTLTPQPTTSAAFVTLQVTDTQANKATVPPPPLPPSQPQNQSELADFIGWDDFKVKAMLAIVKEKRDLLNVKNKKPVWQNIADELLANLKVNVSGSQCYDKFRKLKQSLQKHEDEKKKTGNGTPKPFKFIDLYDIVGDDPTLQPIYICASDGSSFIPASTASTSSSDDEIPDELPEPRLKRQKTRLRSRSAVNEVRELFAESQRDLQETLMTMHNENKELLTRLIDKL